MNYDRHALVSPVTGEIGCKTSTVLVNSF